MCQPGESEEEVTVLSRPGSLGHGKAPRMEEVEEEVALASFTVP